MGKLLLSCQIKLSVKTEAVLTIEKSVTDVVKLFHYHLGRFVFHNQKNQKKVSKPSPLLFKCV